MEKAFANEFGGFPRFDFAFTAHRARAIGMLLEPNQYPWTVFAGEFARDFVRAVMTRDAICEIISVTNVELAPRISKDVDPHRHRSRGRIRTYDQSVNSRPLYH